MIGLGEISAAVRQARRTTPNVVADVLSEAIVRGILKGGVQLRQDALAAEFGISRIPVREALRKLEAEGLVTFHPNRGAVVSELSRTEVQEIYEIRVLLESKALRLAIPDMTDATLQRTEAILRLLDKATDAVRWIELNREFHSTLYATANKPRLLQLINTLRTNVDRYVHIYISSLGNREAAQREHRQILEACRRGNQEAAVRALEQHLARVAAGVATYLQQETGSTLAPLAEAIPALAVDRGTRADGKA